MIDLDDAIIEEDLDAIKLILKDCPERLNEKDEYGRTPLQKALSWGKHKVTLFLLSHNPNLWG